MSVAIRFVYSLYAILAYTVGMGSLVWLMAFLANIVVPKTVDSGPIAPLPQSDFTNIAVVSVYLLIHSVMARSWFKRWWTRMIPQPLERATYVLVAGVTTFVLVWAWQPMPRAVWRLESPALVSTVYALYVSGWLIMVTASFNIDHFSFFGLRQVWNTVTGRPEKAIPFTARFLFSIVRHPISLGWLIVIWATPRMSIGHLLLAVCVTVYIAVVTPIEEADLVNEFGKDYVDYKLRVRAILPWPRRH